MRFLTLSLWSWIPRLFPPRLPLEWLPLTSASCLTAPYLIVPVLSLVVISIVVVLHPQILLIPTCWTFRIWCATTARKRAICDMSALLLVSAVVVTFPVASRRRIRIPLRLLRFLPRLPRCFCRLIPRSIRSLPTRVLDLTLCIILPLRWLNPSRCRLRRPMHHMILPDPSTTIRNISSFEEAEDGFRLAWGVSHSVR